MLLPHSLCERRAAAYVRHLYSRIDDRHLYAAPCSPSRPLRVMARVTSRDAQSPAEPPAKSTASGRSEVLICVNRTCKKQGSQQIAKFVEDLVLPGITVKTTGCLGRCGNGPNVAIDPPGVVLNHMSTPARMAEALSQVAGADVSDHVINATQLRLAGNALARQGDVEGAVDMYTRALDLGVEGGRHLLYSNRAGALQTLGRLEAALEDADSAATWSPAGFHTAYIRQVEIYGNLKRHKDALAALEAAVKKDASFASTVEYKTLTQKLKMRAL